MGLEVGEDVVGERPGVASAGPADADAEPEEVLRLQVLRDRAEAVVSAEPATEAQLEPPSIEVALVVDDEHGVGVELEEAGGAAGLALSARFTLGAGLALDTLFALFALDCFGLFLARRRGDGGGDGL